MPNAVAACLRRLEMKKSKSSKPQDRLSELPDSLIFIILSFLPMRDVVGTTLLSKRWKDLWTTLPCLNFRDNGNDLVKFVSFVNRALILWKGTKIQKLNIKFNYDEEPESVFSDVDVWLRFAIENEVEELSVNLLNDWGVDVGPVDTDFWAPQRLFSCLSIRKLSLVGCQLKIHGNVQWSQLKCLTIEGVSLSEDVINQVLCGTPQLEVLILRLWDNSENLNIHSSGLKTLKIETYCGGGDAVLTIWVPNVETLEISGALYSKCELMNISSLTNATVAFDCYPRGYKLHEDILGQVYHSTRRVEKVTLFGWWFTSEVLGEMKKKDMLAPLSNAKFLNMDASEIDEILGLLELFPKLTTLVLGNPRIQEYRNIFEIHCNIQEPVVTKSDTKNSLESKIDFPKSSLRHLTTIETAWSGYGNSIFPIIEFLLKHARTLEKLVFWVNRRMPLEPASWLLTAEKLLRMPRTSPTAEIILCRK